MKSIVSIIKSAVRLKTVALCGLALSSLMACAGAPQRGGVLVKQGSNPRADGIAPFMVHGRMTKDPRSAEIALPIHPANAGEHIRGLSIEEISSDIGLSRNSSSPLRFQSASLSTYRNTGMYKIGIRDNLIDPDRQVYEVVTTFSQPYWVRGNEWTSGQRMYLIDAVTGEVYVSRTIGHQIVNEGVTRANLPRQPIVRLSPNQQYGSP